MKSLSKPRLSVFNSAIDKSGGPDACWPWTRKRNDDGYGRFKCIATYPMAHRVAFRNFVGPVTDDIKVCHSCDNPPCCNPAHLFLGTQADNVADRVKKGRSARGDKHGLRVHPERRARGRRQGAYTKPEKRCKGEGHGNHKLTNSRVRFIRNSGFSVLVLARKFCVSESTIWCAMVRRTWRHVK